MKLHSAIALVQVGSIFINSVVLHSALPVNSQKDLPQSLLQLTLLSSEPPTEPRGRSGEGGDAGSR